jgi:hypothetical protein
MFDGCLEVSGCERILPYEYLDCAFQHVVRREPPKQVNGLGNCLHQDGYVRGFKAFHRSARSYGRRTNVSDPDFRSSTGMSIGKPKKQTLKVNHISYANTTLQVDTQRYADLARRQAFSKRETRQYSARTLPSHPKEEKQKTFSDHYYTQATLPFKHERSSPFERLSRHIASAPSQL